MSEKVFTPLAGGDLVGVGPAASATLDALVIFTLDTNRVGMTVRVVNLGDAAVILRFTNTADAGAFADISPPTLDGNGMVVLPNSAEVFGLQKAWDCLVAEMLDPDDTPSILYVTLGDGE